MRWHCQATKHWDLPTIEKLACQWRTFRPYTQLLIHLSHSLLFKQSNISSWQKQSTMPNTVCQKIPHQSSIHAYQTDAHQNQKIRNILNLKCPKCPTPSLGHFGHPPHKIPRKSPTSNVQQCEQIDREQTKSLQIIERPVRSHQTFASVHAPLQTTKFNLGSQSSILLR